MYLIFVLLFQVYKEKTAMNREERIFKMNQIKYKNINIVLIYGMNIRKNFLLQVFKYIMTNNDIYTEEACN